MTFEDTVKEYETNDTGKVNKLEDFEVYIAKYFWDAATTEGEKAQRREEALTQLFKTLWPSGAGDYMPMYKDRLRAIIKEAQG